MKKRENTSHRSYMKLLQAAGLDVTTDMRIHCLRSTPGRIQTSSKLRSKLSSNLTWSLSPRWHQRQPSCRSSKHTRITSQLRCAQEDRRRHAERCYLVHLEMHRSDVLATHESTCGKEKLNNAMTYRICDLFGSPAG